MPAVLLSAFAAIYAFISVQKHNHFQSFAWDLGFFDQLIWKISQNLTPLSSLGNLHILGDHFQPVVYVFAPLYWFYNDVRILLVFHAIIAVLGAYPIYLLSRKILKNRTLSLAVVFNFLLYTGFQHAVLDGFHQSVVSVFIIGWVFYSLETKRYRFYWFGILLLLLVKEEYGLLVSFIGLVVATFYRQKQVGLITFVLGILFFFAAIYFFIPFFQKGPYTHFGYGILGQTPGEVLKNIVLKPYVFIPLLVLPPVKLNTVLSMFISFGFLPLLAPLHLLPVIQQLVVRFIDTVTQHRWVNTNHYVFPLVPLLSIASIYSVRKIQKKFPHNSTLALYIFVWALGQNLFYHGPLNSIFKRQFYANYMWETNASELLTHIPPTAIVASQNSLLPHLSHRSKFYLFPEIGDAQYIAADLHDGPNKYSPVTYTQTKTLINSLLDKHLYTVIWRKGESILLKRNLGEELKIVMMTADNSILNAR